VGSLNSWVGELLALLEILLGREAFLDRGLGAR